MSKVYITQETQLNFTQAKDYGDIVFLTAREFAPIDSSLMNKKIIREVEDRFDFDPSEDLLLLSGNPILLGYVFALALDKCKRAGIECIRLLQWNKRFGRYEMVHFQIPDRRLESQGYRD